jgi:hypothetical protein
MEADPAKVVAITTLPVGRAFFADERGVMLRATWHLDRGFLNMSIWHDQVCTATFQLPVADAGRLAGFLVEGLGDATATLLEQRQSRSRNEAPPPPAPYPVGPTLGDACRGVIDAVGRQIQAWAQRSR